MAVLTQSHPRSRSRSCSRAQRARSPSRSPPDAPEESIKFGPGTDYDFSAPEKLPEKSIQRAQELLQTGQLFRYQGGADDVACLEQEFSRYLGLPYTMACNSGGCGLFLSMKALGVKPGDKVLLNAWTLAPVPGAIVHACATPVFVKIDHALTIDTVDLEKQAVDTGAKVLLLSYMRGQIPNMDKVMAVVKRLGLLVVEDCAHTLGAAWKLHNQDAHKHIGTFGEVAVWSLQTNKSINCGEGGLISTSRQDIASFITIATGSYGHYGMNGASGDSDQLKEIYTSVPNMSMRLTTIAAALARPQLEALPEKLAHWKRHAKLIRAILSTSGNVRLPQQAHSYKGKLINVWSSIQFQLMEFSDAMVQELLKKLSEQGIPLAWFGGPCRGFTSTLKDWKFAECTSSVGNELAVTAMKEDLQKSIKTLVDLPLYHTAGWDDAVVVRLANVIKDTVDVVADTMYESDEVHSP